MRSAFDHEDLRVYQAAIEFVAWLEEVDLGDANKVSAYDHMRRASAGVPVNIAQASGKRSTSDRRQFIDTAYGSALECAACLDVLRLLGNLQVATVQAGKTQLSALVSMLIGFRRATGREAREERAAYVTVDQDGAKVWFDHERLDVYKKALGFVVWSSRLRSKIDMPRSMMTALDRASTGVALNIAEGNGKFSTKDRCRFIGHARTAALQAAATLDVHAVRQVKSMSAFIPGKQQLTDLVSMLIAWERSLEEN
ncbi:MAG TPA: four helix bundle protein [Kiritimatiellia bacterium]|nr:four helix bundle protein [Kiritimatiellia bacterium]